MSVVIDHNNFIRDFIDAFGPDYDYVIKAIENNNHKKLHFLKYLSSQGFMPVGSEENLHEMIKIFEQKFQGNQSAHYYESARLVHVSDKTKHRQFHHPNNLEADAEY